MPSRLFSFMNPLATEIWFYMIGAYFMVSVTIWIVARFSPLERRKPRFLQVTNFCISMNTAFGYTYLCRVYEKCGSTLRSLIEDINQNNFYFNVQNNSSIERKVWLSVHKSKKFFLHFSTFHDPLIPKNPQKKKFFWHFFVLTYVCMSRPKSLNISRSPNAKALILVSKHFYIWGIDAIKIVSELVGGFWSYPHFSLF